MMNMAVGRLCLALAEALARPHIDRMIRDGASMARQAWVRLLHPIAPLLHRNILARSARKPRKTAAKSVLVPSKQGGGGVSGLRHVSGGHFIPAAALGCALLLGGCGFHPLYGTLDARVGPTLANVYVEPISDRVGYELRNDLLDLFNGTGQDDGAAYRLKLTLSEAEEAVVLQTDTAITRYNYTLSAHYELIPRGSTTAVKSGDITALAAYNVAAAPFLYATVTAERDAKNRAANDLAERLRTQIAVYLRNAAVAAR
jgi:LPS-assembly lipoprotein